MLQKQKSFHFFSLFFFFSFFSLSLSNPETTALLAFKSSADPFNSLSSWVASSDPCSGSWFGVACDPATRRVTRIVLENLNLTGSAQQLTQLSHLKLLSLNRNRLSSSLNFSAWHNLNHLYLSHNRFDGALPAGISLQRHLRGLDLSHNQFSGEIPLDEFAQLPHLLTLALESNSFTGILAAADSMSPSISDFNVSHNNITGEIPPWLSRFPATSFAGNENLCGNPLPNKCSDPTAAKLPVQSRNRHDSVFSNAALLAISIVGAAITLLVVLLAATWYCRTKNRGAHRETANGYGYVSKHYGPGEFPRQKSKSGAQLAQWVQSYGNGPGGGPRESEHMAVLEGCRGVDKVGDLLKASAEMLGKGSVGATFKVVMDGGDTVVVKRVRERRNGGKEIDGFLRQIGGLRHPNIAALGAYHNSSHELLLVYDFFPGGSLHSALHGNRGPGRTPLAWAARLKLAAGSAEGLAFLHGCSKSKLLHGNLTSSNILVDRMGNACLADIGLQQLLPAPFSSTSAYRAPELMVSNNKTPRKFTQKCDVYSFGVVLLEILTGRMAVEEGETNLVGWVKTAVQKECNTWELLDFELLGDRAMEGEMWALLEVALLCLTPLPKDRPTISVVHRMIEGIPNTGVRQDGAKFILDELTSGSSSSSHSARTS
ncbi:probable leucine-rich repeat receptor-like protein kinase At1g68400 [Pyrus x bretschneideri]|uniref:probable leucine-rich repeat receptor-like protein kinase At1g68400 n=1 Tax=Pyrus x bretschneideri TaxID=225117 RepID=UPI00202F2A6D|nr:probable leucine-rich repeat receptor-like protein kinase At1g68400 [Pyrus x bretschneideri]